MTLYFFFNDTATTEIYTLSLHDALPICARGGRPDARHGLPPGRRPNRAPMPRRAPDSLLLRDAVRRDRPRRKGLHTQRGPARALTGSGARRGERRAPLPRG